MRNVEEELAALGRLGTYDLQSRYTEVLGEPTNGRYKQWLIKHHLAKRRSHAGL